MSEQLLSFKKCVENGEEYFEVWDENRIICLIELRKIILNIEDWEIFNPQIIEEISEFVENYRVSCL